MGASAALAAAEHQTVSRLPMTALPGQGEFVVFVDWIAWLSEWNAELLEVLERQPLHTSRLEAADITPDVIATCWLGYPSATEQAIQALEARLGNVLPSSYRSFLLVSNGWRLPGNTVPRLWSTTEIEWFATQNQEFITALTPEMMPPVPDDEYFIYGDAQDSVTMRIEYLLTALQISAREVAGTATYLLNPQVVTEDGEWEAWSYAHWFPGAYRYRSFWELMQAERALFSEIQDNL
jgi:hypothetical protein